MAGDVVDRDLTSQVLVEYAMDRIEKGGVQPQTVGNDLSHLGAVLTVARPAWGYEVDPVAMADARRVLRKMEGFPGATSGTGAQLWRSLTPSLPTSLKCGSVASSRSTWFG